jgi:hypothetical protein
MSIIQGTSKAAGGAGYEIDQSIRFNDNDSAYLTRTPSSAGNRRTFTFSCWVKRANITGSNCPILTAGGDEWLMFLSGDTLGFNQDGSNNYRIVTTQLFRDPGAWFHLVLRVDTTNATAGDRFRLYINGAEVTAFGTDTNPPLNYDTAINNTVAHNIGKTSGSVFFDGYLAEIHHVDGSSLGPDTFGETNDDGVWIPIKASPTYGTNGFYLTGATSSDLGEDFSGNGNDFSSSGLTAADQMLDTPTNNSSIFSPIASCNVSGQALTISDGNLRTSAGGTSNAIEAITQIGPSSGKWYAEFTLNAAPQLSNQYPVIGVIGADLNITGGNNVGNSTYRGYIPNGTISGGASYGDTFGNGDVIGVALDLDNQKIWFSKNGTYQNSGDPAAGSNAAFTNLTDGLFYRFCISHAGSTATDVTGNFGASAFATAAPTGFLALNTANLATPTIADGSAYFQPVLYTGSTSAQDITFSGNSDLAPDWLWFKARIASNHFLFDKVRGVLKTISSDDATAEVTSTGSMTAFGTDGFSLGDGGSDNDINGVSGTTYVAWGWAAGNSAGSSNSDGSITSTVTANTTAGFSIVKYTGTKSNATIGHGLGVVPKMIMIKDTTNAESWIVYHEGVGNDGNLYLNLTNAKATQAVFQDTTPTSSVFSIGTTDGVNKASAVHVAYCFAEVEGYSSFGGYTGNGSTDGAFVYTGFSPSFIMYKVTSTTDSWEMYDTQRRTINPYGTQLKANLSNAETDDTRIDILSNGFKARSTNTAVNASGATYIYMAFAENPFGGDGAAPATAR